MFSADFSRLKEYNLRRHYASINADKYEKFQALQRKEKLDELLQCLKNQQSVFTHSRDISDSALKAGYPIAYEIAVSSKSFSEGEFIKTCMLKATKVVFPEKRQAFASISLTKKRYRKDFRSLSEFKQPIKNKIKKFIAFSVAIDKSTDINNVAQLAIFIRGVEKTLIVFEEFVEMVPMLCTTTAADIFTSPVGTLDRVGVDWSHAVSLATDGAPAMIGRKAGVITMFREKVQSARAGTDFWTFHCILHQEALCCKSLKMDNVVKAHRQLDSLLKKKYHIYGLPYHTQVRWLSRGAVLRRFYDLREEIEKFMEPKSKPVLKFHSREWMQDLTFMVDVAEY